MRHPITNDPYYAKQLGDGSLMRTKYRVDGDTNPQTLGLTKRLEDLSIKDCTQQICREDDEDDDFIDDDDDEEDDDTATYSGERCDEKDDIFDHTLEVKKDELNDGMPNPGRIRRRRQRRIEQKQQQQRRHLAQTSTTNTTLSTWANRPKKEKQQRRQQRRRRTRRSFAASRNAIGRLHNIVIPIRFKDHVNRTIPTVQQLDILFNHIGPHVQYCPTGSVRDYYYETSYGQLIVNSTIVNWIDVNYTEIEIGSNQFG